MKNDEFFWEVSDYSWSPDGKWVAYSFVEFNRNNKVFLYSLEQDKSVPLTDGFYDSMNPTFDANGDYLYFLSYRDFTPRMDIFEDNHVILESRPGDGRPAQGRPGAAVRQERGTQGRDASPSAIDLGWHRAARLPAAREVGQLLLPQGRQGQRDVGVDRLLRRERVRDGLHPVGRGQVDAERLRHGRPEAGDPGGHRQRLEAVAQPRADDREEGHRLLR